MMSEEVVEENFDFQPPLHRSRIFSRVDKGLSNLEPIPLVLRPFDSLELLMAGLRSIGDASKAGLGGKNWVRIWRGKGMKASDEG